jgi:osmoprotectant transport system permease protein
MLVFLLMLPAWGRAKPLVIGSKKFTESVILGELAKLSLQEKGIEAVHRAEIGGSRILWSALLSGDVDVYPEYTGTLEQEILQRRITDFADLQKALAEYGLGAARPLGFNNTYALGMLRSRAEKMNIKSISDLRKFPGLKIGFGDEFRLRQDGWPGLKTAYRLPHSSVRGLDHDIAYRALQSGDLDLTDLYSTDADIQYYDLVALKDDLGFFPRYEALFIYRLKTAARYPRFVEALEILSGQIDEQLMRAMNLQSKIDKVPSQKIAADFMSVHLNKKISNQVAGPAERIRLRSWEHLRLVILSLLAAIAVAVPLGVFSFRQPRFGRIILWSVGAIQTIPALALLVVLIKPLNLMGLSGIGDTPALIALFLYSLLPIVRGTHSGFEQIPASLKETAAVLGLSPRTRLWNVEFPLALPAILSGVKTAAVINIGFATLGALVGAGGYGQPILTGIRLDNYGLILEGALPAALLALLIQLLFDLIEKKIVSPGLSK